MTKSRAEISAECAVALKHYCDELITDEEFAEKILASVGLKYQTRPVWEIAAGAIGIGVASIGCYSAIAAVFGIQPMSLNVATLTVIVGVIIAHLDDIVAAVKRRRSR